MEDAPAGMYIAMHDCVEDVIGSLGTIVCQCLAAGILAEPSDDLYSHFTISPTTQDGMTKRNGEALVFPQTVQRINHTLA